MTRESFPPQVTVPCVMLALLVAACGSDSDTGASAGGSDDAGAGGNAGAAGMTGGAGGASAGSGGTGTGGATIDGSSAGGVQSDASVDGGTVGDDAASDAGTADATQDALGTPCVSDGECDDGLFCNGPERCELGMCVAGASPVLDDGIACTDDACDETNDTITHTPDDGQCTPSTSSCSGGQLTSYAAMCSISAGCGEIGIAGPCSTRPDRCEGPVHVTYSPDCADATSCSQGAENRTTCPTPATSCEGNVHTTWSATCDGATGCGSTPAVETSCDDLESTVCNPNIFPPELTTTSCACDPVGGCDCSNGSQLCGALANPTCVNNDRTLRVTVAACNANLDACSTAPSDTDCGADGNCCIVGGVIGGTATCCPTGCCCTGTGLNRTCACC